MPCRDCSGDAGRITAGGRSKAIAPDPASHRRGTGTLYVDRDEAAAMRHSVEERVLQDVAGIVHDISWDSVSVMVCGETRRSGKE